MGFGSIVKGGQSLGNAAGAAVKGGASVGAYQTASTAGIAGVNAQGNNMGADGSTGDLGSAAESANDNVGFADAMAGIDKAAERKINIIQFDQKLSDKVSNIAGQMGG